MASCYFLLYRVDNYVSSAVNIENGIDDNSGVPVVHTATSGHSITTNPNQMENGDNSLDSSVIDNLNHQRCISQNEGIENDVALMPLRKKIQCNISSESLRGNAFCCKVFVIFGVCSIIGCYLIPVIFYYAGQIRGNPETNPEFSDEKNTSTAKVCCKLFECTHLHI